MARSSSSRAWSFVPTLGLLAAAACGGSDSGNDFSSVPGAAGSGTAGSGIAGTSSKAGGAGTGTAGTGTAGTGTAGTAGSGTSGSGPAGNGGATGGNGGSGTAGTSPTGGAAGSSTTGGSAGSGTSGGGGSGTSGGGGASGAASGAAGTGTAGTGTAGTGTAGTGTAGTGTAGTGTAGTGTAGTGTAGTGTAGTGTAGTGTAGSSGGTTALDHLGEACTQDANCGTQGLCLKETGKEWFGGGPANGYCSTDCGAYLANPTGTDPCEPGGGGCFNLGTQQSPVGRCLQLCETGKPAIGTIGQLSAAKCHGRGDTSCYALQDSMGQFAGASICRPQCASDADCPGVRKCDLKGGACVDTLVAGPKKNGDACDVNAMPGQCAGYCVPLATGSTKGVCIDPCEIGAPDACGGNGTVGFCGLFDIFSPDGAPPSGQQDLSGCGEIAASDTTCLFTDGWFTRTIAGGTLKVCYPASQCNQKKDCQAACVVPTDCPTAGATCSGGKCLVAGQPDTGTLDCLFSPSNNKKFCVDHSPL